MGGRTRRYIAAVFLASVSAGCFLDAPVEPYLSRTPAPQAREFRWSDGGLPRVFDPAMAVAPPDTDLVRAVYEGLTENDPKTLKPIPAAAERWEPSEDFRIWTFHLRENARWSNGDRLTASDFVRSWNRTSSLGEKAPHARLMDNIETAPAPAQPETRATSAATGGNRQAQVSPSPITEPNPDIQRRSLERKLDVQAVNAQTLKVHLKTPDPSFPSLVAHTVFRPVHGSQSESVPVQQPVGNGAFVVSGADEQAVVLERSQGYWDAASVHLDKVSFAPMKDAEEALSAYKAGQVDAITNANFEPLALKLLKPYDDFRRATYGALTYYDFNRQRAPFNDVRVREALTRVIDRRRISEDVMGGATEPAYRLLPFASSGSSARMDVANGGSEEEVKIARQLLANAGFPQGIEFPRIKLLINRNEQQRMVAESIAEMWKDTLGIETDIVVKNWDDYEAAIAGGDFDIVRRSIVMQTVDEATVIRSLFSTPWIAAESDPSISLAERTPVISATPSGELALGLDSVQENSADFSDEKTALENFAAIPISFASSYALVKPYVAGFDSNLLDVPLLKNVRIESAAAPGTAE